MGQGKAELGGGGAGGGDAGHDLDLHPVLLQIVLLLARAAEHRRIAALQAHHL